MVSRCPSGLTSAIFLFGECSRPISPATASPSPFPWGVLESGLLSMVRVVLPAAFHPCSEPSRNLGIPPQPSLQAHVGKRGDPGFSWVAVSLCHRLLNPSVGFIPLLAPFFLYIVSLTHESWYNCPSFFNMLFFHLCSLFFFFKGHSIKALGAVISSASPTLMANVCKAETTSELRLSTLTQHFASGKCLMHVCWMSNFALQNICWYSLKYSFPKVMKHRDNTGLVNKKWEF